MIAKLCDDAARDLESLSRRVRRNLGVSQVDIELQSVAGVVKICVSVPELGKTYYAASGEELAKILRPRKHLKLVPKSPAGSQSGKSVPGRS